MSAVAINRDMEYFFVLSENKLKKIQIRLNVSKMRCVLILYQIQKGRIQEMFLYVVKLKINKIP